MFFGEINYVTVVIAAIISMGLGFLWYSPIGFGKRWMKEMNFSREGLEELKRRNGPKGMVRMYTISTLSAIVTAFVIAALLNSLIVVGFSGLFLFSFLLWLAFSLPVAANAVIYGRDSVLLFLINSGYYLLCIIVSSLVISLFS